MSDTPLRQIRDNARIIEESLNETMSDEAVPMRIRVVLANLAGRASWIHTVLADK